jgi:hypothetical protein
MQSTAPGNLDPAKLHPTISFAEHWLIKLQEKQ